MSAHDPRHIAGVIGCTLGAVVVSQTGGSAMSSESKAVSERDASLANTGKCAMDSIREMVAALECDYDRLEELRDELQDAFSSGTGI